jgi:N-acetylmuramoyl-L-alanine amidase
MPVVIVKQGDHLARIAKQYGFADYRTIWNHAQNAQLRQKRENPHVLHPGDEVFVPELQTREESKSTEQKHPFVLHRLPLTLRLVLEDVYERPIANAACELAGDTEARLTTDAQGEFEQPISPMVHDVLLTIRDPQTAIHDVQLSVKVGDLDPVDEISGQQGRLKNLGYYSGPMDQPDERLLKIAIEEFQCENGLTVDGICGPNTQKKLKQVHGS